MSHNHSELRREAVQVWAIAWPVILTNLLKVMVGIVDLKMVGALGTTSIAAVGMARHVMMFLMVLTIAVSGGSSVLVAHAYGSGDRKRVSTVASRSIVVMVAVAILAVTPAGLLFSRPILLSLGGAEAVVDLGCSYLRILFLGSVFAMFNFAVTGILLGVGKTRVSLVLLIGINGLNVVLNYLLIFGVGPFPAMGVAGAALGTVIARAIGSAAGCWIAVSPRFPVQARLRDGLVLDMPLVRRIVKLGGPRSLQGIVRNFSRLMTLRIITLLPDSTRMVSAYSVGMQVRMISTFVGLAFMAAASARVGQNLGGGRPDRAEQSGWASAVIATAFMSVIACLLFLFPEHVMAFFTSDREVIAMGRTFFIIVAVTEPIMALSFAMGGALRGGGDPMSPFIYGSVSDLLVVIVAGYVLAVTLNMGFAGIALGMAISAVTRAIPTMLKFRQGKWKSARF
ncbi:MAG: MATE family efflux transporter [Lentisphaerae bacterium]|nr:MATE family efflux transporter [Lentisphaerota bacterium]MBT4815513.1 MATE family efflux transporter [Lentisphaerota bacterium]MBT5606493.1 MATE family efflux transporter [Lentisphaerota bacterium]MBT7846492.1 MATE family efflux transporter [Lentisphaerota bacterium]